MAQKNYFSLVKLNSIVKSSKLILFKTHLEENMNSRNFWGSGELQPLVAEISITTKTHTLRKMSLKKIKKFSLAFQSFCT